MYNSSIQTSKRGFIATTAILMITYGCLALALTAGIAVRSYDESIDLSLARVEARRLNDHCMHRALDILARDYFVQGEVGLPEYDCEIEFDEVTVSRISIVTSVRYLSLIMNGYIDVLVRENEIELINYFYE